MRATTNIHSWAQSRSQPAPEEVCHQILADQRSFFLADAARHDPITSRVVLFEKNMISHLADMQYQKKDRTNVTLFSTSIHSVVEDYPQTYGVTDLYSPCASACIQYRGVGANSQMLEVFNLRAFDVAFALVSLFTSGSANLRHPSLLPAEYFHLGKTISHHTGLPSDLETRWLMFLHLLGWQQVNKYPIRAKRFIGIGNETISFGDIEHLQDQFYASWLKERLGNDFDTKALHFFGSDLCQDINVASVYAIDFILSGGLRAPDVDVATLGRKLEKLLPGHEDAHEYQNTVYQVLNYLFNPSLQDGVKEEKTDKGRERIDIVYANRAEDGYFHELRMVHEIKCPYVFFECKNYSSDIANDEFAQLYSRLSAKRGQVGFLVCRKIDDQTKVWERCKDYYNKHGVHILIIDDSDLRKMIEKKASGDINGLWTVLREKFRMIVFNQ
jgi:hypothetical protein